MASKKTICEGCGKKKAGGGMRFCYGCYGIILSNYTPVQRPEPTYYYPPSKRKKRTS